VTAIAVLSGVLAVQLAVLSVVEKVKGTR